MQLCPVSIAVGCAKCPVVKVCPGKGLIGDSNKTEEKKDSQEKKSDK